MPDLLDQIADAPKASPAGLPTSQPGGDLLDQIASQSAKPAANALKQSSEIPQLKPWTPTLGDRFSGVLNRIRTSAPVESLIGRTPAEIAANPALESAPTTTDAGVMGLFQSKKPLVTPYENPTTAADGLHNWAAGVVNSVASPGGIATAEISSWPKTRHQGNSTGLWCSRRKNDLRISQRPR